MCAGVLRCPSGQCDTQSPQLIPNKPQYGISSFLEEPIDTLHLFLCSHSDVVEGPFEFVITPKAISY